MFKKQLAVACCSLCLSGALSADSRFYAIGEAGYTFSHFDNLEASTPFISTSTRIIDDNDSTAYVGFGVGYDWAEYPLRAEIIYSNMGSQGFIEDTIFSGSAPERTTASVDHDTLMFNLLYDIKTDYKNFKPYVGAGIGFSRTQVSAFQVDNPVQVNRYANFAEDTETNIAWNLIAGARYTISNEMYLGVGYRYMDAGTVGTASNCSPGPITAICDQDESHSGNLINHSLFVNLNYYF